MEEQSSIKTEKTTPNSILTSISMKMAILACISLFAMMMFVTIDVAGRNFFNWPLRGTFEIVGLLLIPAATWGLGMCQIVKKHLRIPVFYDMFSQRVQLYLDILAYVVCVVAAGLITWQMMVLAIKYIRIPFGSTTETLGLPFSPFMLALAWGFGWLCVILLVDLYKSFQKVIKK